MSVLNYAELREFYDQLWQEAIPHYQTGEVQIDPFLLDRQNDYRRGLSVIARPDDVVLEQIGEMLAYFKQIDSEQYYYQRNEIHITVLSLFTATENFGSHMANYSDYRLAVDAILSEARKIRVNFTGITASRSAVMVQGFPYGSQIGEIREGLRQKLREKGLVEGLDGRYRIKTAHATVIRFQKQITAIERLIEALKSYREMEFGTTAFTHLELVKNDWYMSTDRVEVLAEYCLS
jgi:2'-5' RNA ligase